MRQCWKMWWRQTGRRWQHSGALHAGLVRLHACKHTSASVYLHPHPHSHAHRDVYKTYCFSRQQWFRERASLLRYTYIVSLAADYEVTHSRSVDGIRPPCETAKYIQLFVWPVNESALPLMQDLQHATTNRLVLDFLFPNIISPSSFDHKHNHNYDS